MSSSAPWTWRELEAAEAKETWQGIARFVSFLVERYDLGDVVPACWWAHGAITEELTALWAAWNAAYLDPEAPGDAPLAWHERFTLSRTRLGEWDRLACAQRGHREAAPVPWAFDDEAYATFVAKDIASRPGLHRLVAHGGGDDDDDDETARGEEPGC